MGFRLPSALLTLDLVQGVPWPERFDNELSPLATEHACSLAGSGANPAIWCELHSFGRHGHGSA